MFPGQEMRTGCLQNMNDSAGVDSALSKVKRSPHCLWRVDIGALLFSGTNA